MEQQYGICKVAVSPLRAAPSDKAEITTQLLFGEQVEILEKDNNWWLIRNAYDGYEGWLDFKQLAVISKDQYAACAQAIHLAPAQPLNVVKAVDGSVYYLAPGSNLPGYADGTCFLGTEQFDVSFMPHQSNLTFNKEQLINTALFFQNAPYLWGGKTLFGIDCSGFTQVVFKLNGINLKRDAWQQAEQGLVVDFLPEATAGDLAYFDNDAGRITHVGIMLGANAIIHASGKVRIDPIDHQGIYNAELGRYTHKLRIIKRLG